MNRLVNSLKRLTHPGHKRPASRRATLSVESLERREVLTSGFTMGGAIAVEYGATARETDLSGHSIQQDLGALTSNEMYVPGMGTTPGNPRMNTFEGGAIYWSPGTGAHVVFGGIGAKYSSLNGPTTYGLWNASALFLTQNFSATSSGVGTAHVGPALEAADVLFALEPQDLRHRFAR
jgi:hypothetical protein